MTDLTPNQITTLQKHIVEWRKVALPAGPIHPAWDSIIDAEALLDGKQTLLRGSPAEIFEMLTAEDAA